MNVTEVIALTLNVIEHQTKKNVGIIKYLAKLILLLGRSSWRLLWFVGAYLWFCIADVAYIGLHLICLLSLILLIGFIKSLQPRYNFHHQLNCTPKKNGPLPKKRALLKRKRKTKSDACPDHPFIDHTVNLTDVTRARDGCPAVLTNFDIHSVYQRLSWSHTKIDFESISWFNQTLKTLWPSIKTVLNKYVFEDVIRPKKVERKQVPQKRAKLSVYLSIRRKLEKLRRHEADALYERKGYLAVVYVFKLLLVYMKQLVMDYIMSLLNKKAKDASDKGIEIKLKVPIKHRPGTKSWAGFDNNSGRRGQSWASLKRRRRKLMSAPGDFAVKNQNRVLYGSSSFINARLLAKLRDKRLKLTEKVNAAHRKLKEKAIAIKEIRLGESIPRIEGIQHIEEGSDLRDGTKRPFCKLTPSDNNNMRFIIELSYDSDRNFLIRANNLPLLNNIKVTKISYQIRLLVTLNHSTKDFDEKLEVFASKDEVLFPMIRYAQITLVDVPSLNWSLYRLKEPLKLKTKAKTEKRQTPLVSKIWRKIRRYLDPVYLINHTYFKYLAHTILYLVLRWFRPFDIKIGKNLYLKTIC